MGSILVKDLLFRVSKDLGDGAPQFQRWTQKELVHALNDGQREIALLLPHACARVDAVKLAGGTRQSIAAIPAANLIPGDGSTPPAILNGNVVEAVRRSMGADGLTPGAAMSQVSSEILDNCMPNWHAPSRSGVQPTDYMLDAMSPSVFYVAPGVPAADSFWVEVVMLADPVEVPNTGAEDYGNASASTQALSIGNKYLDDLRNYIMSRAHMKDAESQASAELATAYRTLFTASISAQSVLMQHLDQVKP